MKSLEVKAAEYVYASIADGYFSKEVKNGNVFPAVISKSICVASR